MKKKQLKRLLEALAEIYDIAADAKRDDMLDDVDHLQMALIGMMKGN